MSNQIRVATKSQAILMELELKGQVSDGYWENSSPRDHWKPVCSAEVIVDPDNVGINFGPSRSYNFAAPKLIEYVGDRMQMFVLLSWKYPTLSARCIKYMDSGKWMWEPSLAEWQQTFIKEMKTIGVESYADTQQVINELNYELYPIKALKKDLKALNDTFKIVKF